MILTNRKFEREAPVREAKSIYIFCEGVKREYQYFDYFKKMDSRINVEIYKLHPHEDNSPLGLLSIAKKCIIFSEENPKPKYTFQKNDEVWIVLDTDKDKDESREPQINTIKEKIQELENWNLVQSNPCFEVWLYYHMHQEKPNFEGIEYCVNWKELVNNSIKGGFDSRRHPIFIESATNNSENNFEVTNLKPNIGSTEVFKLSKSILPIIKFKLQKVLKELEE
ncbi:RloB family protein [Tenacibaculum maritimum]|uniref:RloB family protein n=1 Tax=Tenacibaculum maritimum TaxID=107401 RepID=UPI0023075B97|nr:RloB family protein [Tenacibaculum maritimum]MDB0601288.1 RloB family protein [Tenacibaculum maritimum]MDB0611709.1 RloB family protein [Tenacibaculum maritimum]